MDEVVEGLVEGRLDVEAVDGDALVEGLVDLASDRVGGLLVEPVRVSQEFQGEMYELGAGDEVVVGVGELLLKAGSVFADLGQAGTDLGRAERAVGGEVEQALFAGVEALQLAGDALSEQLFAGLGVAHGLLDALVDALGKASRQGEDEVVRENGFLDLLGRDVRQVAAAVAPVRAEVVLPALAASSSGEGVDESRGAPGALAVPAEQHSFEVVVVHALALAAGAAGGAHLLHPVEQLRADDRLVAAGVLRAFVDDASGVVGVAEHLLQLVERHWPAGSAERRAGGQALVGHRLLEPFEGVGTGGVQLEGLADERGALLVHRHGADLPAVEADARVDVAERGAAKRAAVLGLLAHLVLDVLGVGRGLEAVEDGQEAGHRLAERRVI